MDWANRKVLSFRLSNTLDTSFCTEALEEVISQYWKPHIFNTDQGSQFTSEDFTGILMKNDIKISMDGRGRWIDNVFIERLWKSSNMKTYISRRTTQSARPQRAMMLIMVFHHQPHGKLLQKSTFQNLTPESGGKKIEPFSA